MSVFAVGEPGRRAAFADTFPFAVVGIRFRAGGGESIAVVVGQRRSIEAGGVAIRIHATRDAGDAGEVMRTRCVTVGLRRAQRLAGAVARRVVRERFERRAAAALCRRQPLDRIVLELLGGRTGAHRATGIDEVTQYIDRCIDDESGAAGTDDFVDGVVLIVRLGQRATVAERQHVERTTCTSYLAP